MVDEKTSTNTTMGKQFFEEERRRREERGVVAPGVVNTENEISTDIPPPLYRSGVGASQFQQSLETRAEEIKEELAEEMEHEEYAEIKRVLKKATQPGSTEKPFTIKLLKERMVEIEKVTTLSK